MNPLPLMHNTARSLILPAHSLLLWTLSIGLFVSGSDVKAGPFEDGRLFLHFQQGVSYSDGNPIGKSGTPSCEDAVTSVPRGGDVVVVFVIATFPDGQAPTLHGVSFGLDYDPARLEIIDSGNQAYVVEQSVDWPAPGSSTHLTWKLRPQGQSLELYWFAVRTINLLNSRLQLTPGEFGGQFYGPDGEDIDGFGTFGFGVAGSLDCPPRGACCLPDGSCSLLTEGWCSQSGGYFAGHPQDCSTCDAIGACCYDWACEMTTEEECAAGGGEFEGPRSTCGPTPCDLLGACCDNAACTVVREDGCIEGTFLPGVPCDPLPCFDAGACCFNLSATCLELTASECSREGGNYLGVGSVCSPGNCDFGVCCFEDPEKCIYWLQGACLAADGEFRPGDYGPLEDACWLICGDFPATIQKSWGSMKSHFRDIVR